MEIFLQIEVSIELEAACRDAAKFWVGKTEDNQSNIFQEIFCLFIIFFWSQAEHAEAGRGGAEGEDLGAGQHHQEQPRYKL